MKRYIRHWITRLSRMNPTWVLLGFAFATATPGAFAQAPPEERGCLDGSLRPIDGVCSHYTGYEAVDLNGRLRAGQRYCIEMLTERRGGFGITNPSVHLSAAFADLNNFRAIQLTNPGDGGRECYVGTYEAQGCENTLTHAYSESDIPKRDWPAMANMCLIDEVWITPLGCGHCICGYHNAPDPVNAASSCNIAQLRPDLGATFVLNVSFASGQAQFAPRQQQSLRELKRWLMRHGDVHIAIRGHTDSWGMRHLELSQGRAQKVFTFLTEKGVDRGRLCYTGMGDRKPLVSNATTAGRRKNRRVDVQVVGELPDRHDSICQPGWLPV